MVKKSNRFFVVSIISLVIAFAIVGVIIAAPSAKYQSVPFGHGADQVIVTYNGNPSATLEYAIDDLNARYAKLFPALDSNGCIVATQEWCVVNKVCIAKGTASTNCVAPVDLSGKTCTSSANSCGMKNTGTTDAQGVCSATTPLDSACVLEQWVSKSSSGGSCATFCPTMIPSGYTKGAAASNSLGEVCRSKETYTDAGVGGITEVGQYCYRSGQKRDNDGTDVTNSCYCKFSN